MCVVCVCVCERESVCVCVCVCVCVNGGESTEKQRKCRVILHSRFSVKDFQ